MTRISISLTCLPHASTSMMLQTGPIVRQACGDIVDDEWLSKRSMGKPLVLIVVAGCLGCRPLHGTSDPLRDGRRHARCNSATPCSLAQGVKKRARPCPKVVRAPQQTLIDLSQ